MESTQHRHSVDLFTKLSNTTTILPYYGYADECRQLMTQLRHQSRELWTSHIDKWFQILSPVKRVKIVNVNSNKEFQYLLHDMRYAMYTLRFSFTSFITFEHLDNFLENIKDKKLLEVVQITTRQK